jgi:hypothetical protein
MVPRFSPEVQPPYDDGILRTYSHLASTAGPTVVDKIPELPVNSDRKPEVQCLGVLP